MHQESHLRQKTKSNLVPPTAPRADHVHAVSTALNGEAEALVFMHLVTLARDWSEHGVIDALTSRCGKKKHILLKLLNPLLDLV